MPLLVKSQSVPLLQHQLQVCMHKIIAFVEQWFALIPRQGVAEAVSEVEVRGVSATPAVIAKGLTRNFCLGYGHWLYSNLELLNQFIDFLVQSREFQPLHDHTDFDVSCC